VISDWTRFQWNDLALVSDFVDVHCLFMVFRYTLVQKDVKIKPKYEDYHKPTDTYENINEEFYIEAVRLIIEAIKEYDSFLLNESKDQK